MYYFKDYTMNFLLFLLFSLPLHYMFFFYNKEGEKCNLYVCIPLQKKKKENVLNNICRHLDGEI